MGPILFLIYINNLDGDITSKVLKFAIDTKVFRKNKSDADRQQLQDDLNKLTEWFEKWQMLFNYGKCKCLRSGNEDVQYTMGDTVLNTTVKEKDLYYIIFIYIYIYTLYTYIHYIYIYIYIYM